MALEFFVEDHDDHGYRTVPHLIAGGVAGMVEHCGMFPFDTIKTHMQIKSGGMYITAKNIVSQRGVLGLFRGLPAAALGSAPIHGVSFTVYEFVKSVTGADRSESNIQHFLSSALSGVAATFAHDACIVPVDTIKQKLQFSGRDYKGITDCIIKIYQTERFSGFFRGYTPTLIMNIPFGCFYFATYESVKKFIKKHKNKSAPNSVPNPKLNHTHHNPMIHLLSGAVAGAVAAGVTNPLDVSKTRLQVGDDIGTGKMYKGMTDTLKTIVKEEGWGALGRGIGPRMIFHSTSAALSWTAYEYLKYLLGVSD
eukprot:TRINITY_DN18172_c0_g1_i2.p1 TRINITY_DN18172_c0_g1~~TRINITY_DN18172_c0_g1_i2.p1  ORF type:complete len:309 (+),score=34.15 TRINITY_DN18172_c0_g1_i2:42-968(+)